MDHLPRTTVPLVLDGTRVMGSEKKTGYLALNRKEALKFIKQKKPYLYLKVMTDPSDVPLMERAECVITLDGGPGCHAAIICRMKNIDLLTNVQNVDLRLSVTYHPGERVGTYMDESGDDHYLDICRDEKHTVDGSRLTLETKIAR